MKTVSNPDNNRKNALVIGGSLAGLMAARILSDHFDQVTILERDPVHDEPESRKGQSHTRHLHGLLAQGLTLISQLFPGIEQSLAAGGAIFGDMGLFMRWYHFDGYKKQYESGLIGGLMSRPFLEWHIRQRVLALPNVTLLVECDVEELLTTSDQARVVGVRVTHRGGEKQAHILSADLVVDASGRGSATPKWLATLGYPKPPESTIRINMGYATRIYRRRPNDLVGAELVMIAGTPPHDKRAGLIFPIEEDRWIVTLSGTQNDHAPLDEAGFLEFARSLAAPDIYKIISRAEPLSNIIPYKFPASLRRHYEKLRRFPNGYLVMGDALCSFNPIYGQGMTSAVMQAAALGELIGERGGHLPGLWRDFFRRAAKVVDIPWQLAAGEDFRYPETQGKKAPGTDLVNRYVARVHRAAHYDTVVYGQFLRVMNLMAPPTSLFNPAIIRRVLRQPSAPSTFLAPQTATKAETS